MSRHILRWGDYEAVQFLIPNRFYHLIIVDPPYGGIIDDQYDKLTEQQTYEELMRLAKFAYNKLWPGGTLYMFGGIGKRRNRPFPRFLIDVEHETRFHLHNVLTWKKRRGIGTQSNYMFTREEIAFLVKGPKPAYFDVQRTKEKRSKEWVDRLARGAKQPISEFMRVSNVLTHINELFRNKRITAEKPVELYRMLIRASCPPGGWVLDPMCGSGTTFEAAGKEGRNSACCEMDLDTLEIARKRFMELGYNSDDRS